MAGLQAQAPSGATANTPAPTQPQPKSHRLRWTLVGAGAGFGLGFWLGFNALDDATYAERKIMTVAIVSGAGGAVVGNLLGKPKRAAVTPIVGPRLVGVQFAKTF